MPDRISDTRRFVLACLTWMAEHRSEIRTELQSAQTRWTEAWKKEPVSLPLSAKLKEVERAAFDWVDPIRDEKGHLVGEKSRTRLELPSFVGFEGSDFVPAPAGYLVDPRSTDSLAYWGLFHTVLLRGNGMWGEPTRFPLLAVGRVEAVPTSPVFPPAPSAQE